MLPPPAPGHCPPAPAHLRCRRLQPPRKANVTKILPHIAGVRTDEQLREFLQRCRADTVRWLACRHALCWFCLLCCGLRRATHLNTRTAVALAWLPLAVPAWCNRAPSALPPPQALVNFGSSWCRHCHQMFPHFLSLSKQFPQLKYAVAQVRGWPALRPLR